MKSSRKIVTEALPLALPLMVLGGLALLGGGFDLAGRHVAGIGAWLLVLVLLLSPYGRGIRFPGSFVLPGVLLAGLVVLSAVSALWSSSVSASLIEAQRVVAYLGFFTASFLVCRTGPQRRRFVEGLFLAIALIVLVAIIDRCFPGTALTPLTETARQRFPLGYWNANGLVCGIGIVLFAWMNRAGSTPWLRWSAAALIPVAAATLYLTYSRGGLVSGVVALVAMFFLSRHRLRLVAVVGAGLVAALPAIVVIGRNLLIAEDIGGPGAPAEGRAVALALLGSMILSVLLVLALKAAAKRYPGPADSAIAVSRDRRSLQAIAATGAIAVVVAGIAFGGDAWRQFSGQEFSFPDDPKLHFTQLTGAGRYDFNQVAVETFLDNPLAGTGAGTYRFQWAQQRDSELVAQDAHSLYFEAFSDLGVIGGLLVLALIASLLGIGFRTWSRAPGDERDRSAVLLASMLAMVFALGIDWTWELAATAALFMLVSGCLAAGFADSGRAGSVLRTRRAGAGARARPPAGKVAASALIAWVAIAILAVPLAADRYMKSSATAAAEGRVVDSINDANRSSDIDPWSPAPHLQLGVIAQSLGLYGKAREEFREAARLEPENWQPPYLTSLLELELGDPEAAMRALDDAAQLNPRSPVIADQRRALERASGRNLDGG